AALHGARVSVRSVPGHSPATWERAAPALASALGVPRLSVSEPRPGTFALALRTTDPLAAPVVLDMPVASDYGWDLPLGVDEHGLGICLPISDTSGVLCGGTPGSGKSAWLRLALSSFGGRVDLQVCIIDGRGGHDHDALASRCW